MKKFPLGINIPLPQLEFEQVAKDPYHRLLSLSWVHFFLYSAGIYMAVNLIFAGLYMIQPGGIENIDPNSFWDHFNFSVQTISTIGYGNMYPTSTYTHTIVFIQVFIGVLNLALATGVFFAKVSLPTANMIFSEKALITSYDQKKSFMIRVANTRSNQIIDAKVYLTLMRKEKTKEGVDMRRFYDMKVVRKHTPLFSFSWTIIHIINEESPLYGWSAEELANSETEFIVTLMGIDGTYSQTIFDKYFYNSSEIHWGGQFSDILYTDNNGVTKINYDQFHKIQT